MSGRAVESVWWPGLQADIERTRRECRSCDVSAPSQPSAPPTPLPSPAFPFEQICADYFNYGGSKYLVIVDRFSNWLSVQQVKAGAGAEVLVKLLRKHFLTYGVSVEIATDGGLEFVSSVTQDFLSQWGVHHRDNVDSTGSLDNDRFTRALMNYRNTPVKDVNLSPAQIIFGRKLRDHLPVLPGNYRPKKEWILSQHEREIALARRYEAQGERLTRGTRILSSWDKTRIVVETQPNDQYIVKIDGSGQITLRNRQFLRKISKQGSKNLEDVRVSQPLSSEGGGREKRRHRSGKLSIVITLRQTLSI